MEDPADDRIDPRQTPALSITTEDLIAQAHTRHSGVKVESRSLSLNANPCWPPLSKRPSQFARSAARRWCG